MAAEPDPLLPTLDPPATRSLAEQAVSTGGDRRTDGAPLGLEHSTRYRLGDEIARGGMGVVHRATDTVLDREVALKVLHAGHEQSLGAARRFTDEARITGQLQHPAIPPIHDLGKLPDGTPFLAMKLVKGETLESLLAARPDPAHDRGRFVAAFEQICQALAYAHAHSVIHRDLKPANIMVGSFGEVQVMDWGLAKVLGESSAATTDPEATTAGTVVRSQRDSDGEHTQAGSVLGTPAYMPPEQALGALGKIDSRSDVFGLGGILAAILTGKPPFTSGSVETTRMKSAQGKMEECFARLDTCGADPELIALCKHCLNSDPSGRPADGGEVAREVARLRQAADERARQAELDRVRAESGAREQRMRWRVRAALAAAVGLVLMGGGFAAWWREREAATRERDRLQALAEAEHKVTPALANAGQFASQARTLDLESVAGAEAAVGLWRQAVAAVEQAEGVAATAGDAGLLGRVAGEEKALRDGLMAAESARTRARRDVEFVAALDSALAVAISVTRPDGPSEFDRQLVATLVRYGIPVEGTVDEIAGAFRGQRATVRTMLFPTLDRWFDHDTGDRRDKFRKALDLADGDPFRRELRSAVMAKDRAALLRLAGREEIASLQPLTLCQFAGALQTSNEAETAEKLMRAGRDRFPDDFWIHFTLASTLHYKAMMASRDGTDDGAESDAAPGAFLGNPKVVQEILGCARTALALRPRNSYIHVFFGSILVMAGDPKGAEVAFLRAIELDPKSSFGHFMLGNIYQMKFDWDRGEAELEKALALDPQSFLAVQARAGIGMIRMMKGDLVGAEKAYQQAVELDPKSSFAYMLLGSHYSMRGDRVRELAARRKAVELDPASATMLSMLVRSLEQNNLFLEAEAAGREAIRLDPTSPSYHVTLGDLLLNRKEFAKAETVYREAIRLGPKKASHYERLGGLFRAQGRLDAALAEFQNAVRLAPKNARLRIDVGRQLHQSGKLDEAVAEFQESVRLDSKMWGTQGKNELQKAERSRDLFRRLADVLAGKSDPKSPAETAEFANLCAQPFVNRFRDAARLFERAFVSDPKLSEAPDSHRYNAACFAARAARGDGVDAPREPVAKADLREKALVWLKADLDLWRKRAMSATPMDRARLVTVLTHWQRDPDLAALRPGLARMGMPATERAEWDKLWSEVTALLAESQRPATKPESKGE